jgi:hypothetical protein
MTDMHAANAPAAPRFQVHAYSLPLRVISAVLQGVAAANLLYLTVLIVFFTFTGAMNPTPPARAGWLFLAALVLWGLVRLLHWLTAATLSVEPERLVLERRGDRFEIPLASVDSVRPWWLFPPGSGLTLRMKSGRAFQYALGVEDPLPVLEAMGGAGLHPNAAFARARFELGRRRWYHLALKFVLFPLLPTALMFRLNQIITYGGWRGQYRMYGLGPYLQSFATYWVYFIAMLVLFAIPWRAMFELVAFVGAWLSPPHARGVRRFVEIASAVVYYAGIPALIAWRFLE